jgi:dipicolinate synthase subunit B
MEYNFKGVTIGFAVTGSFCTFTQAFEQARILTDAGAKLIPIMSENAFHITTRFGEAKARSGELEEICGAKIITTIADAEPLGPGKITDIMLVCPCTGNTMAKLANSITDGVVAQ